MPSETASEAAAEAWRDRPTFQPGAMIAGRYRVERFVARGGMGEVYEATDLELSERVAVKTLRRSLSQDKETNERFRAEVLLARRVTHPNVCRLFEFGTHRDPDGTATLFLTMELLVGETLGARLLRGRMTPAEALPIVRQMAAALDAAHKTGILHRDFKSENVFLVPEGEGLRVVVTDFGLARVLGARGPTPKTEGLVGSPGYMAPEQVRGEPLERAADIYALGVVLFEMVTGELPFSGESALGIAVRRLFDPPPPARSLVPDLPVAWERAIQRCLALAPGARFPSAGALPAALDGSATRRLRLRLGVAAVAALAVGAVGLGVLRDGGRPARPAVAVLALRDLGGKPESAWLSTALGEMLSSELAAGERLRLVPGDSVARATVELGLGGSEAYAPATLSRVRSALGVDYVVTGTYVELGAPGAATVRLDLRLGDTRSGEVLIAVGDAGPEAGLTELVARAGERLRDRLGVKAASGPVGHAAQAVPRSTEAARLYAEGLGRLRLYDPRAAEELLGRSRAAEPSFPLVHAALADAVRAQGRDDEARRHAERALELAAGLGREERLVVEARLHETAHAWDRAIDLRRALHRAFPDQLEHGLALSQVLVDAGRGKDALATIEALRRLPPPACDDARLDAAEMHAADATGEPRRALAAAARTAAKARALGARLLLAEAREFEAWALRTTGDAAGALAAVTEARRLYEEAGHRARVADSLDIEAFVRMDKGELSLAGKTRERTLEIARELGSDRRTARILANHALVLYLRGELGRALELARESESLRERSGDLPNVPWSRITIGRVLLRRGELAEAERVLSEVLEAFRKGGNKRGPAQALGILGEVAVARGDLAPGRERLDEARTIVRGLGGKGALARLDLQVAAIDLEEGHAERAVPPLRAAIGVLGQERAADAVAQAQLLLHRALLQLGQRDEGGAVLAAAQARASQSESLELRLGALLAAARAEPRTAADRLARVLAEADRAGYAVEAIEALLGQAPGDRAAARQALERARRLGLGRLAKRAEAAMKRR